MGWGEGYNCDCGTCQSLNFISWSQRLGLTLLGVGVRVGVGQL